MICLITIELLSKKCFFYGRVYRWESMPSLSSALFGVLESVDTLLMAVGTRSEESEVWRAFSTTKCSTPISASLTTLSSPSSIASPIWHYLHIFRGGHHPDTLKVSPIKNWYFWRAIVLASFFVAPHAWFPRTLPILTPDKLVLESITSHLEAL